MELKSRGGIYYDFADYDSTKAALDELEARVKKLEAKMKEAEKDVNRSAWMVDEVCDDIFNRLTALEDWRDDVNVFCHKTAQRLTAPEAKVDPPKTFVLRQGGKVIRTFVDDPDTCGNCAKAWRQDGDRGFVLCAIETKNWHRVHCGKPSDPPRYKANGVPGCSHHARREEA